MSVRERDGVGRARRQAGPGGQRGKEGRRAGGERLRCGPAERSRWLGRARADRGEEGRWAAGVGRRREGVRLGCLRSGGELVGPG
jgi:hypothetical protein